MSILQEILLFPSSLASHDDRPVAARRPLKRLFDIIVTGFILITVAPVLAGVAAAILLTDGRPFLFSHTRIGAGGRTFGCLKFRTMRRDAEVHLAQVLAQDPARRAEWEATQKLRDDPRVNRLGRFLRASSLDELPQLINVLHGDMSLVGPRPITRDELPKYGRHAATYLEMKPGITGLWQVSGRSDTTYARRVRLDVEYFHSASLIEDIRILCCTVRVVLFERSAH